MANDFNRFLGDTPGRTVMKLVVASLIVGFIMTLFDIMPVDLLRTIRNGVMELWRTGFETLGEVGSWLLLGASVVIPVFILIRLTSFKR